MWCFAWKNTLKLISYIQSLECASVHEPFNIIECVFFAYLLISMHISCILAVY